MDIFRTFWSTFQELKTNNYMCSPKEEAAFLLRFQRHGKWLSIQTSNFEETVVLVRSHLYQSVPSSVIGDCVFFVQHGTELVAMGTVWNGEERLRQYILHGLQNCQLRNTVKKANVWQKQVPNCYLDKYVISLTEYCTNVNTMFVTEDVRGTCIFVDCCFTIREKKPKKKLLRWDCC